MGKIKNMVLGNVSGAVGNVVFKLRGKTCYLARKPKGYRTPQDSRSIFNRNQLGTISLLAKVINSVDLLRKIWHTEFPDCYTVYHKILSSNFHQFRCDNLSGTPILTPHPGFTLIDPVVENIQDALIVKSGPLPSDSIINYEHEKNIVPASLLIVKSYKAPDIPPRIYCKKGMKNILELNSPIQLITKLNHNGVIISDDEYLYKSWSVLITLDDKDNPMHFSEVIPWTLNQ